MIASCFAFRHDSTKKTLPAVIRELGCPRGLLMSYADKDGPLAHSSNAQRLLLRAAQERLPAQRRANRNVHVSAPGSGKLLLESSGRTLLLMRQRCCTTSQTEGRWSALDLSPPGTEPLSPITPRLGRGAVSGLGNTGSVLWTGTLLKLPSFMRNSKICWGFIWLDGLYVGRKQKVQQHGPRTDDVSVSWK